jgi:hypothetical protein
MTHWLSFIDHQGQSGKESSTLKIGSLNLGVGRCYTVKEEYTT